MKRSLSLQKQREELAYTKVPPVTNDLVARWRSEFKGILENAKNSEDHLLIGLADRLIRLTDRIIADMANDALDSDEGRTSSLYAVARGKLRHGSGVFVWPTVEIAMKAQKAETLPGMKHVALCDARKLRGLEVASITFDHTAWNAMTAREAMEWLEIETNCLRKPSA